MDRLSMVSLASGELTVAAAYEVTGEQLTRYFIQQLEHSDMTNGADWWDNPKTTVDLCVLDGDFDTQTPSGGQPVQRAKRVLVVIEGDEAFAWAFCFPRNVACGISTTDPASI
jgi:hypothetical protein